MSKPKVISGSIARLVAALASILLAVPTSGAVRATEGGGRFTMSPADGGGFARLDKETGQMSLCQRRGEDWSCREMSEPGRGLDTEIDRLREENKRLKAEIRQMEDILLGQKGSESGNRELRLPTEKDLDDAMSYAQRMIKKFREKLKDLEAGAKGTPL